jgi:hypothetical protein
MEQTVKVLIRSNEGLIAEGRWDLDYHLPPELIERYPEDRRSHVSEYACVSKDKRDPSQKPDDTFMYVDIASIDVEAGAITNPQEMLGEEAPSRARMVMHAYDVIVSTCRPTRGAIAVVPPGLHGEICSTGFTVLRCKDGVNPFFLQYVLRLDSTLEQFRKFATGSSYPAILDSDVLKTQVPSADSKGQDAVAASTVAAFSKWKCSLEEANSRFKMAMMTAEASLRQGEAVGLDSPVELVKLGGTDVTITAIRGAIERHEAESCTTRPAEALQLPI